MRNYVIQIVAILKLKFAMKVDFDKRSAVCFFCLVKLIPTITTSPLAVIQLIKSIAKNLRCTQAMRVELLNFGANIL